MRAISPTKEKMVPWVVCSGFGALLIILAVCVYQWRQSNSLFRIHGPRKPLSEAFHAVYQKVLAGRSPPPNFIRPQDIRDALAYGPDDLGETPALGQQRRSLRSRAMFPSLPVIYLLHPHQRHQTPLRPHQLRRLPQRAARRSLPAGLSSLSILPQNIKQSPGHWSVLKAECPP